MSSYVRGLLGCRVMLRSLVMDRPKALISSLAILAFACLAWALLANEVPAEKEVSPPEAPGYNTRPELLAAIITGRVRILT